MSFPNSGGLGNSKIEETGLTAASVVAKTQPGVGQSSCCFWSAAQKTWSNAVWENDLHQSYWTYVNWPLYSDSAQFTVVFLHPAVTKPVSSISIKMLRFSSGIDVVVTVSRLTCLLLGFQPDCNSSDPLQVRWVVPGLGDSLIADWPAFVRLSKEEQSGRGSG